MTPPTSLPRFRLVQGRALGERTSAPPVSISQPQSNINSNQNGVQQYENQQQQQIMQNSNPVTNASSPLMEAPPSNSSLMNGNQNMMASSMQNSMPTNMQPQPSPINVQSQMPMNQQRPSYQPHQNQQVQPHMAPQTSMQNQAQTQAPPPQQLQQPVQQQFPPRSDLDPVTKCIKFLKTLINLSNNPSANRAKNTALVRQLIGNILYGEITAEEFTGRLQEALNSQAQPHLLPFLKNTIPALRAAVKNGEVSIEEISPPAGFVFNNVRPPMSIPMDSTPHSSQSSNTPNLVHRLSTGTPQVMPQRPPHGSQIMSNQGNNMMMQSSVPPSSQPSHHSMPQMHQQLTPQTSQQHDPNMQKPMMNNQSNIHSFQPSTSQSQQQPTDTKHDDTEVSGARVLSESSLNSALLIPQEIMNRITKRMMESCLVEEEALMLITDSAESHLREIITQIAGIAEHRAESMRIGDNYIPIDDTKRQLRFLEELDRQEEELRESREKETLIRMSKNKNIGKETIDKAKEIQKAEAEAKRNRDANAAAIAALSSNRTIKPKWEGGGSSGAQTNQRPRTVRITTRDLHLLVNSDSRFSGTFIREKLAYGGPSTEMSI